MDLTVLARRRLPQARNGNDWRTSARRSKTPPTKNVRKANDLPHSKQKQDAEKKRLAELLEKFRAGTASDREKALRDACKTDSIECDDDATQVIVDAAATRRTNEAPGYHEGAAKAT
ncbi:MAG: hypothetical protein U0359_11100 [Byssovorax sp.]